MKIQDISPIFKLSIIVAFIFLVFNANSTTINFDIINNQNWSDISPTPTSDDIITVKNGVVLTIDVANAVCMQVQLGSSGLNAGNGEINFNSSSKLTVSGTNGIALGDGSYTGTVDMTNGGTLVTTKITQSGNTAALISGTGTIELSTKNTLPKNFITYNNLTINGDTTSVDTNITIVGILKLSSGTFNSANNTVTLYSDGSTMGSISGDGIGTYIGQITTQRYISGASDYRFISTGLENVEFSQMDDDIYTWGIPGSDDPAFPWASIYYYDETGTGGSDTGWASPGNMQDTLVQGRGYAVYIDTSDLPVVIDFTGTPVLDTVDLPVTYTITSGGDDNDGWNLVGNPYASAIDWDDSANITRQNINNAIYIWNQAFNQYSSYVSGIGSNGGTNIIASNQSFWVKASAAVPKFQMRRGVCTDDQGTFFKLHPMDNILKLKFIGNNHTDETVVRFLQGAVTGFDGNFDAYKLFGNNALVPSINSVTDSCMALSINALPELSQPVAVPLVIQTGIVGSYTIQATEVGDFGLGVSIILEDMATGIKTDLRVNKSYTFNSQKNYDACSARFMLHFTPVISATDDIIASNDILIFPNPSQGIVFIQPISDEMENMQIDIYNMMGSLVYTEAIDIITYSGVKVDLTHLNNGNYLLRCSGSDKNISKKIIVVK